MKALSKQIEESIIDGINTYKELAAIGRGFDVSAFSKMCAGQIRREALRDVDKAFDEWMEDPNQTSFIHITPINELWFAKQSVKNFAMYYAQRCGVEVDGECEHPYHSVVGGNGSPERCLKCGKILSN